MVILLNYTVCCVQSDTELVCCIHWILDFIYIYYYFYNTIIVISAILWNIIHYGIMNRVT